MDRRSDPTNELYEFAREAYACSDYEQAVYFLRKASALAPMRQDIRQFLAEVLAQGGSSASGSYSRPNTPLSARSASASAPPAPEETLPAASSPTSLDSGPIQQSLRRLMARLPFRPLFSTSGEEDEQEEEIPSDSFIQPVARIEPLPLAPLSAPASPSRAETRPRATAVPVSEDAVSGDSDLMNLSRSDRAATLTVDVRDETAADFSPSRTHSESSATAEEPELRRSTRLETLSLKKASRKAAVPAADPEEQSALETVNHWVSGLPAIPRRVAFFSGAYLAAALFMTIACFQSYKKFFGAVQPSGGTAVVSAPAVVVASPVPTATSAPVRPVSQKVLPPAPVVSAPAAATAPAQPSPGAELAQARQALKKGQLEEAAKLVKSVPGKTPGAKQLLSELAKAYDQAGTEYIRKSQFAEAVAHYSRACGFASASAEYTLHLGNAYYYLARRSSGPEEKRRWSEKAVEQLQRSLELDGENVETLHRLATVHTLNDRYPQARECWTRALNLLKQSMSRNGKKVETYQRLAMVLECLGRSSEARSAYESILKLADPRSEAAADARFGLKALGNNKK